MLQRRDIEIAHRDGLVVLLEFLAPIAHRIDKAQLLVEFLVHLGIRDITSGRHIEIMQQRAIRQFRRDMALMAAAVHIMRRM